jgi:hypothetical protein
MRTTAKDALGRTLLSWDEVAHVSRHGSTVSIKQRTIEGIKDGWVKLDGNTQFNCNPKNLIRLEDE